MSGKKVIWVVLAAAMIVMMFRFVVNVNAEEKAEMADQAAAEVEALTPLSLQFIDGAMVTLSKGWSGMSGA